MVVVVVVMMVRPVCTVATRVVTGSGGIPFYWPFFKKQNMNLKNY